MASGVDVNSDCRSCFLDVKLGHKYRYVVFKLKDDLSQIVIEKKALPEATYEEFVEDMRSAQSSKECRYAVYDMSFRSEDGLCRSKILFFMWSPEEATVRQKMVYSSSKDALKKALGEGISREIQSNDMGDLDIRNIMEILMRTDRR